MPRSSSLFALYLLMCALLLHQLKDAIRIERLDDLLLRAQLELSFESRTNASLTAVRQFLGRASIVRPFVPMFPEYLVAKAFGLAVCLVPKNMSTLLTTIFCLLNSASFEAKYARNLTDLTDRDCAARHKVAFLPHLHSMFRGVPRNNLLLTRHPFERFLSAFLMLCVDRTDPCFGCGTNMLCVSQNLLQQALAYSPKTSQKVSSALWHMSPQNWHCDLKHRVADYDIMQYSPLQSSNFSASFIEYLREAGVPANKTAIIQDNLSSSTTYHQTINNAYRDKYAQTLYGSSEIQRNLVRVYFYDFIVFGIPIRVNK